MNFRSIFRPVPDGGNLSRDVSFFLAGLTVLALILYSTNLSGWPQAAVAILVYTFVPGAAVLSFLPRLRLISRIGLAAAFSMTLIVLMSYAMLLTRLFYPAIMIWSLFPVAALLLVLRAPAHGPQVTRRSLRSRVRIGWGDLLSDRSSIIVIGVLLLAIYLWIVGASSVDYREISDYGLVPLLPTSWKLALALTIIAISFYATRKSPRVWLVASSVAALVAMIYITPIVIYDVPHYPWNYKHVGVTELVLHYHRKFSFVDIYNRWPSFFGAAGIYTNFGGFKDTLDYVGWAELYFVGIQATLVAAIALTEDKRIGLAAVAASAFVLIDWIGQAYFSPQAMAFTLMLAVLLIVWSQLYNGGNALGHLMARTGGFLVRKKQEWPQRRENPEWSWKITVALVIVMQLAVAMVHQLTPYVLLIQMVLLTGFGYLRPRWLVLACAFVTVAYLAPQFAWVNSNFGVLGSLDPFANAGRERVIEVTCNPACEGTNKAIMLTTAAGAIGALVSVLILGRRRPTTRIPLLLLSFVAPFLTLLGQSYGGEAILRVVMFSAPFSGILIALALFEFRRGIVRMVVVALTLLTLGVGFFLSYYGLEEDRYLTPDEVKASKFLYANAPFGSVAVPLAPNFPGQLAFNYWTVFSPYEGIYVNPKIRDRAYTPAMVDELANWIEALSPNGFVIFSPEMERYTVTEGVMPIGAPKALRDGMLKNPRWKLWNRQGDVEIFRTVNSESSDAAAGATGGTGATGG